MFNLLLLSEASESLWMKILTGIPHGPAAILLYLVLAVSVFIMWRAHQSSQ